MTKIIRNYQLHLDCRTQQVVAMPKGAKALSVQVFEGRLFVCALIDPTAPCQDLVFDIVHADQPADVMAHRYIGSVVVRQIILHVFGGLR
jgi:hypothetical protein